MAAKEFNRHRKSNGVILFGDLVQASMYMNLNGFEAYVEKAPKGVRKEVLELGFWLGVEPGEIKQRRIGG